MLNIIDPIIKRFMENVHNSVTRRDQHLSSPTGYANFVAENRLLKIFCAEKNVEPNSAATMLSIRYGYWLSRNDVIETLRALHLSYQAKRTELFDWANETVDAFATALETRTAKDFEKVLTLRDKNIFDRDGKRFKIQERVICLMLCVKHPELFDDDDIAKIEKFGNEHMKYFLYDVIDFLRNICIGRKSVGNKISYLTWTLKDLLTLICAAYPSLTFETDAETLESLDGITLQKFLCDALADDITDENFYSDVTVEEFLSNDPDADSLLIPAPPVVSTDHD